MEPIPTRYKGYHFRSRLEARWAVFFDTIGMSWEYEPEGFEIVVPRQDDVWVYAPELTEGCHWYLPDFHITDGLGYGDGAWIEIKPNDRDYDYSPELRLIKCISHGSEVSTLLIQGNPYPAEYKILGHARLGSGHMSLHGTGGRFVKRYMSNTDIVDNEERRQAMDEAMGAMELMDAFMAARSSRFTGQAKQPPARWKESEI